MDDLALAQEAYDIVHIRVIAEAEDVVVCHARLLLGAHVLVEVGDHIARDRYAGGVPRCAGRRLRVHPGGVVDKIRVEPGFFDLIWRHVARELVDDGAYHFEMPKLLRA